MDHEKNSIQEFDLDLSNSAHADNAYIYAALKHVQQMSNYIYHCDKSTNNDVIYPDTHGGIH